MSGAGSAAPAKEAIKNQQETGRGKFQDFGVDFTINSADGEPKIINECTPPKYEVNEDRVILYSDRVQDKSLGDLQMANGWVPSHELHEKMFSGIKNRSVVSNAEFLPTTLGNSLHPRQGVKLGQADFGNINHGDIMKELAQEPPEGDKIEVELNPLTVEISVRQKEKTDANVEELRKELSIPPEKVPENTDKKPVVYNYESVEATVTPRIIIRNHGQVTAHKAANRMEVSQ